MLGQPSRRNSTIPWGAAILPDDRIGERPGSGDGAAQQRAQALAGQLEIGVDDLVGERLPHRRQVDMPHGGRDVAGLDRPRQRGERRDRPGHVAEPGDEEEGENDGGFSHRQEPRDADMFPKMTMDQGIIMAVGGY